MDLFSQFPESKRQEQFLSKINDDKMESNNLDDNSDKIRKQNRFENIKKVDYLRKKNKIVLLMAVVSIFLILFVLDDILIDISVNLVENYAIKEELTKTIIRFINKIIGYLYIPIFLILYLKYPLQYSFTYMSSLIIIKYIHAILFLIYGVDRQIELGIRSFFLSGSEKPNMQLQLTFAQFFGFWRLLKSKPRSKRDSSKYKKIINIYLLLSCIILIFTFLAEIFVGYCSINNCLMGLIIGIIVYTVLYERLCIQFMKGKVFVRSIAKNYFFFAFIIFINLLVATLLFHNYNGISNIFEEFDFNPWGKWQVITQKTMNQIVLKKSLFVIMIFSIIYGIRDNYKFVISKKNKNYYNLEDIAQFNRDEKLFSIFKRNFIACLPGLIVMSIMNYLQYKYKVKLVYYLATDIFIFGNFGYVYFGSGIKKSLKRHLEGKKELEDYQNLNYSGNKNPGEINESNNLNNII